MTSDSPACTNDTVGAYQYANVMATRPVHASTDTPLTDEECDAVWRFVERRALVCEINYERNVDKNEYPPRYVEVKAADEFLQAHPELADDYYSFIWSVYWDRGFNEGAIDLIAEASGVWLAEHKHDCEA